MQRLKIKKFNNYIDLHTHSTNSDGSLSTEELCELAINNGIWYFAITDHNYINKDFDKLKNKFNDEIQLINGVEISTIFDEIEIHIIALGINKIDYPILNPIIKKNINAEAKGEKNYINAIRKNLSKFNINLPDYDTIKMHFNSKHVGMSELINFMIEKNFCKDSSEALDYIGLYGKRLAYANRAEFMEYVSMEEVVNAILKCKNAIPVLCHPLSYKMDEIATERLIWTYKNYTNNSVAAMEVFYGNYNNINIEYLKSKCQQYNLLYSGGSDYHGTQERNKLSKLKLENIDNFHIISYFYNN